VQALTGNDQERRLQFCSFMQMETDSFVESIVFSDEATFLLSGKVNRHNVRIWRAANPHAIMEHAHATPSNKYFLRHVMKKDF
jgi:hypothetical protein